LMNAIYPIECNPRAHTAAVAFADEAEDMADAYLSVLPDHEPKGISNGHQVENLVVPRPNLPGYYVGNFRSCSPMYYVFLEFGSAGLSTLTIYFIFRPLCI
jgi:hypothetical protein